ncbi:MAG: acyl-CoA thioesterase [Phycisphaerae bacterium]
MANPTKTAGREPVIRVMMMPRDTNANGTIFGGVILSYLDQAGAVHARQLGRNCVVTVAMDSVEFKQPVFVGDVLSFYAETLSVGRTSARIRLSVEAERFEPPCERVAVTAADIVYVSIGEDRRPVPFRTAADDQDGARD